MHGTIELPALRRAADISGIDEVSLAFVGIEVVEEEAGSFPGCLDGSFGGLSHQVLELGEDLLDRVEVGAVGRQEQEPGAHRADRLTDGLSLAANSSSPIRGRPRATQSRQRAVEPIRRHRHRQSKAGALRLTERRRRRAP